MKARLWLLALVAVVLGVVGAPALANTATLAELARTGGTVVSGDKVFSDFAIIGLPVNINPEVVTVEPYYDATRDEYGIRIGVLKYITSGTADLELEYTVTAGPGWLIHDNTMGLFGGVDGTGAVSVSETPYNVLTGYALTSKLVGYSGGTGVTEVHKEYTDYVTGLPLAVKTVNVHKDILLEAGTNGSAQISGVIQTFSQRAIPEPLTMVSGFLAISGLGMYLRRRTSLKA